MLQNNQLHPPLSFRCKIQFRERAYVVNIRLHFKWRLVLISGFHWNADLQLLWRERDQSQETGDKKKLSERALHLLFFFFTFCYVAGLIIIYTFIHLSNHSLDPSAKEVMFSLAFVYLSVSSQHYTTSTGLPLNLENECSIGSGNNPQNMAWIRMKRRIRIYFFNSI